MLHRWLGLAGGIMLSVWYFSGLGLHWRAIPNVLAPDEVARSLGDPFTADDAAVSFGEVLAAQAEPVREIRLRRAGSRLVYEIRTASGRTAIHDAHTGASLLP